MKNADPIHCDLLNFEQSNRVEGSLTPDDSRWLRWSWFFVGLGIVLRLVAFSLNFPLWWDEAFVAVNLLQRDLWGLLRPLDYGQVCPWLFLSAEWFSVHLCGFHEWSLRLFPLLCSIGSMILFRIMAGRILRGPALVLAVGVFAVSFHPIRHSADVKPYASDLLTALALQAVALEWLRRPTNPRWLWVLSGLGPVALLLSHPSIFVVGGVGLGLGYAVWQTRLWNVRIAWIASGLVSLATYAVVFQVFTGPQASATASGMKEMWVKSFPPLHDVFGLLRWLMVVHSGDMLAYPCGGERGASTLSLIACLVGVGVLIRQRLGTVLAVLIAPLGLALIASALRLYPYGGPAPHGSAARIMQYAAPGLCLLIGLGASRVFEADRSLPRRDRVIRLALLSLIVVGIVPQVAGFFHPYRAYQAEASREFAKQFWSTIGKDSEVACLRWDFPVAEWDSIHLGVAVALCNQAIYSPSRRDSGPRFDRISASHPLRCVLSVAPSQESPRLDDWLTMMRRSYDLRRSETIHVPISESGRPLEFEDYQVFEFVPRAQANVIERREPQSDKGL